MGLKETIPMMTSEDYQERFKGEYFQLKLRFEKLESMLEKYKAGILNFTPSTSYELLFEQLIYMKNYLKVLKRRAEVENININS